MAPKKPDGDVKKVNLSRIIALGASTGGTEALYSILQSLPSTTPGMLIIQHIPPGFSKMFAERMNNLTQLNVKEAEHGDVVEQGKVLVAPGGKHMKLKRIGGRYKVDVKKEKKSMVIVLPLMCFLSQSQKKREAMRLV